MDAYQPLPDVRIEHPEWSRNATIYQINTRQFTPEGTFRAAEDHLPRLKELGATILWLMPVQQIGEKNRKGTLGSPYAVKNYYSVEPALGTLEDLRHFVTAAHDAGMYVIVDWIPNHTAWDSNLVTEHPEWYDREWKGDLRPTRGGIGTTSSTWTTPSPNRAGTWPGPWPTGSARWTWTVTAVT